MSRKEDYPSETSSGRGCFFIVFGAPSNGASLTRLLFQCVGCARERGVSARLLFQCVWCAREREVSRAGCFLVAFGAPANGASLTWLFFDRLLICLWAEWYHKLVSGRLGTMTVGGMVLMVGFTCLSTTRPWTGGIDSLYLAGLVPLVRSLLVLKQVFSGFSTTCP